MTKKEFKNLSIFQIGQLNYGIKRFGEKETIRLCEESGILSLYPIKYINKSFLLDKSRVQSCFTLFKNKPIDIIVT